MSPPEKRFSVLTVTVTAAISFLVSGVGGAFLQRYLARAKPIVTITSTGFAGPTNFIDVPDTIVEWSRADEWGDNLAKFELYSTLRDREAVAAEVEAYLKNAISVAEKWLADAQDGPSQAMASEIRSHPVIAGHVFSISMTNNILQRELTNPPVSDISNFSPVFPLYEGSDGPIMHMGLHSRIFPRSDLLDAAMRSQNRMLAESFAHGVRSNIVHYTREFLEDEHRNLGTLKDLREGLRELLLRQAMPTVSITVHNAGSTATTFRPYFGMVVLGPDRKTISDRFFMLIDHSASEQSFTSEELNALQSLLEQEPSSKDVVIEPYLPPVGSLAYTTVPPGQSASLRLVATESLGTRGTQYRDAYASGLLSTRILALTVEGKAVWSNIALAGADINKSAEDELTAMMR